MEFNYIIFESTYACNQSCKYCYNISKVPGADCPPKASFGLSEKVLKQCISKGKVKHITFSGGEPFLNERILELILMCRMKHVSVSVLTNGNVMTKEQVDYLLEIGVTQFSIPLHSLQPGLHESMTSLKGSWNKAYEMMVYIRDKGGVVIPVVVITKINMNTITATLGFLKKQGFRRIMVNRFNVGGSGISNERSLTLTIEELRNVYHGINAAAGNLRLSISSNVCTPTCILNPDDYKNLSFAFCSAGFENMPVTVDYQGAVRLCNHSPVELGNILKTSFEDMFSGGYVKKWFSTVPIPCRECHDYTRCRGGCKAAAEQLGLGIESGDPCLGCK